MPTYTNTSTIFSVADALQIKGFPYEIKNDRLYELLTYGDGLSQRHVSLGSGNWNQGSDMLRAVLTYLVQRAFGIHRLPWHHDRSCDKIALDAGSLADALTLLKDTSEVEAICAELRALRNHTYTRLKSAGATHMRLCRGLLDYERSNHSSASRSSGYATRVATMATIARRLEKPSFDIPFDVLSSWGDGGYAQRPVVIESEVPIEAVLCFSDALATRCISQRYALESGEWIVLNTAVDGRISLKSTCVVTCNLTLDSMQNWSKEALEKNLESLGLVYGPASSMYSDRPSTPGRERWWSRIQIAWNILRGAPF